MNNESKPKNYLVNIRTLFAAIGVIFVWRGLWGLMDHYLFPDNPDLSYFVSLLIGIIILLIDDFRLDELKRKRESA